MTAYDERIRESGRRLETHRATNDQRSKPLIDARLLFLTRHIVWRARRHTTHSILKLFHARGAQFIATIDIFPEPLKVRPVVTRTGTVLYNG